MTNIIQFPGDNSRITALEIIDQARERVDSGKVQFLLIASMDFDTHAEVAMTTMPAHCAVYLNQLQRMSIEQLVHDKGMVP